MQAMALSSGSGSCLTTMTIDSLHCFIITMCKWELLINSGQRWHWKWRYIFIPTYESNTMPAKVRCSMMVWCLYLLWFLCQRAKILWHMRMNKKRGVVFGIQWDCFDELLLLPNKLAFVWQRCMHLPWGCGKWSLDCWLPCCVESNSCRRSGTQFTSYIAI